MSTRALSAIVALCVSLWAGSALAVGNAWHIPDNAEPGIASMREPVLDASALAPLTIYSGNQFQGPGNPGNQLQAGSLVLYRLLGAGTWSQAQLVFFGQNGNNKYYAATLPSGTFAAGDIVEYYLRIAYSDQVTTYLHGDDDESFATDVEATAQADPFRIQLAWPLAPSGSYLSATLGEREVRIYEGSGHIELLGPDLDGNAGVSAVTLVPARAEIDGAWYHLGPVVGSSVLTDGLALTQELAGGTVETELRLLADGVARYEVVDWGALAPSATAAMALSPSDEQFYGFGEKFNSVGQAGNTVRVLTADPPGDKGDQSYKVMPWLMSTRGYGMHLDSTAESSFAMRSTASDRFIATNLHGTLAYHLVHGPRLTEVLERYTAMTGRPTLPPPWAFAPWMSSDHWRTGGEIRYVVTRFRDLGIPASVFVFDSPWETAYNDFTWNTVQFAAGGTYDGQSYSGFASPAEMLTFLRDNGFKVVLWMTPFVNVSSYDEGVPGQNVGQAANYAEAAANGYFVRSSPGGPPLVVTWWKGDGSPVDFTNAAARTWITSQLQALVATGAGAIGGFKTDDGEGDFIPLGASYSDGRTGVEMKNGYSVLYHQTVHGVLGDQGILFARSGFTGTQAFPACWAGDNEPNFGAGNGLPSVIVAGLSAAMSGYSIWGHDIGGYQETNPSATPENLFMRWTQFGALSPIMQMHRQVQLDHHYPWSYGPEALDNFRRYAELHTKLFPYLYSYARVASETGLPIIRPPVLHYQEDAATHDLDHTYLFGEELLVAPMITNDATTRTVYLPEGAWYDYWNDTRHEGGANIDWQSADQTLLPLFVREGAIVPLLRQDDVDSLVDAGYSSDPTLITPSAALEVLVYPAGSVRFDLYDGTQIESADDTITFDSTEREVLFRVLREAPAGVWVDGAALDEAATPDELDALDAGWSYAGGKVLVKHAHTGGVSVISFTPPDDPSGAGGGGMGGSSSNGGGAPDPGADEADEGCSCRAAGAPARGSWMLLLLLGAAAARALAKPGLKRALWS